MNWINGVRKRVRFQNNTKVQKEFFERKRLDISLKKKKVVERTPSQRRHGVSQDLLALQIVNKFGSDNVPERPVKKVDMSKFKPCFKHVQDVELGPLSPVAVSPKLNMHEMKQNSVFTPGLANFCKSRKTTVDANKKKEISVRQKAFTSESFDSHSSHNNIFIPPMGPLFKPNNCSSKSIKSSNNTPVKFEKETLHENLSKQQTSDLFTLEDFQITPLLKYEKPIHSPGHVLYQARTSTPRDLLFSSKSVSSLICRDLPTFQNEQSQFKKSTNRTFDPGIQNIISKDDESKFVHSQYHTKQTKFLNRTNVEAADEDINMINMEKETYKNRHETMNERHFKNTEKYRDKLDSEFHFSSPYDLHTGISWEETEKNLQESYIKKESDSKMFAKSGEQEQLSHSYITVSESPMYVHDSNLDFSHSTKNSLVLQENTSINLNALQTSKHNLLSMKTEHLKNIWTKSNTKKMTVQEVYDSRRKRSPEKNVIKFLKGAQILDLKEIEVHENEGKQNCEDHEENTMEIDEIFHIFQFPNFLNREENAADKGRKSSSPKPAKEYPQSLAIDHDDMIAASTMSDCLEWNKSAIDSPNRHSAKKNRLELWYSPTVADADCKNKKSSLTQERHLKQIGDVVQEVCQLDDQDMCGDILSQNTDLAKQDADLDEADIYMASLGYDQLENVLIPEDGKTSTDDTSGPNNPPSHASKHMSCNSLSTTEVQEDLKIKQYAENTDMLAESESLVHSKSCENSVYLDQKRGDFDTEMAQIHHSNIVNQYEISNKQLKLQTTEINQDSSKNQSFYETFEENVNPQISKVDEKEMNKSANIEKLDDIVESVVSGANQNAFHQNHVDSENAVLSKTCKVFTTISCSKIDDSTCCEGLSRPNVSRDEVGLELTKDAILYNGVSTEHDLFDERNNQSKKSYTDMATSPIVHKTISRSTQCSPELIDKYSVFPIIPGLEVLTQKTLSVKPISNYYRQIAMKEIAHVSCQTETVNSTHS